MSYSYWGIDGYGIRVSDIHKYIDCEKVKSIVRELTKEEVEDVFEDDTFCGNPYTNFGEFLCELDDDDIFTFDDDGNGESYFLYTPPYPWSAKENEPETQDECKNKIMAILRKVCTDNEEEIERYIDYISDWGSG